MRKNKRLFWLSLAVSQVLFAGLLPVWFQLLSYLHPVVIGVVWFAVTLLVFFVVYYIGKGTIGVSGWILNSMLGIYSLGLFILLFFRPSNQKYSEINIIPFRTIIGFLSGEAHFLVAFYNIAANIVLFVPYGVAALLFHRAPSKRLLFLGPVAAILLIETAQFLTKRGSMDIDDLILNVLGVGIGYLLYPVIVKVLVVK